MVMMLIRLLISKLSHHFTRNTLEKAEETKRLGLTTKGIISLN